ncbi:MAG: hypothetical protein AAGI30_08880 [Planctomycetota bacterium]
MRRERLGVVVLGIGLFALPVPVLSGCNHGDSTLAQWRRQPTPELETYNETAEEFRNRETLVNDMNARMLRSDTARFLLLDRPSRLQRHNAGY